MKKLLLCTLLLLAFILTAVACSENDTAETPTGALTQAATDASTTASEETSAETLTSVPVEESTTIPAEVPTETTPTEESETVSAEESDTTPVEEPTEEPTEVPTEEPTEAPTEAPVEPTALYTAEDLAAMTATNSTVTLEGDYAHFLTGTTDTATNPSVTLTAEGEGFSDIIAIKYRTNCGSYGSNFWGTFLLNGTAEFNGNRRDSDNWFFYMTNGEWDVLILDMRKNKAGADGVADTDVTGGAAIQSLVYNFFDYTGNGGKLATADGGEEYFDIASIAFFETKDDAADYFA